MPLLPHWLPLPKFICMQGFHLQHNQHFAFDKVTGNWGQDDGIGEMTLIAPSTWQIVIPNAMTYFGVPVSDDILA